MRLVRHFFQTGLQVSSQLFVHFFMRIEGSSSLLFNRLFQLPDIHAIGHFSTSECNCATIAVVSYVDLDRYLLTMYECAAKTKFFERVTRNWSPIGIIKIS